MKISLGDVWVIERYLVAWLASVILVAVANAAGQESAKQGAVPVKVIRNVPYVDAEAEAHDDAGTEVLDETVPDPSPQKYWLADVYLPEQPIGRLPTILMVHGGAWFSGNKVHVAMHAQYAAERGFAVVAINYRLAPAYPFPAQLEDCEAALRWVGLKADVYGFDRSRVAAYGYSAGAHLVCLLGMTRNATAPGATGDDIASLALQGASQAPLLRGIVAGGTPCDFDWIPLEAETLGYWLGGSRQARPEVYRQATPRDWVDRGDPPTFFFHGERDRIVPISSAQRMQESLRTVGTTTALHVVPSGGHMQAFLDRESRQRAITFLQSCLETTEPHRPGAAAERAP